jgi:hypothetical protein
VPDRKNPAHDDTEYIKAVKRFIVKAERDKFDKEIY